MRSRENMSSCSEKPLSNRLLAESKYLDARPLSSLRPGGLVEEGRSSEDEAVIFADFISSSFTQSAGKLSTGPLQVSARQDTAVATAPLTTVSLAGMFPPPPEGKHPTNHRWHASVKTTEHKGISVRLVQATNLKENCCDVHKASSVALCKRIVQTANRGVSHVFPYFHSLHIPLG